MASGKFLLSWCGYIEISKSTYLQQADLFSYTYHRTASLLIALSARCFYGYRLEVTRRVIICSGTVRRRLLLILFHFTVFSREESFNEKSFHQHFFYDQSLVTRDCRLLHAACFRIRLCLERFPQSSNKGVSSDKAGGQSHL